MHELSRLGQHRAGQARTTGGCQRKECEQGAVVTGLVGVAVDALAPSTRRHRDRVEALESWSEIHAAWYNFRSSPLSQAPLPD